MSRELAAALAGIAAGTAARWYMLRVDYRNYPSYPHGYLTHLALGVVAAFLGGVSLPALVAREYTAVTFLALAAQQFREVRSLVREGLAAVEESELVRRGADYIEGIARLFEARNYLVMLVAVLASAGWLVGGPAGSVAGLILGMAVAVGSMRGTQLGAVADITIGELEFRGPSLYVEGIFLMNVGLPEQQRDLLRWARGLVLTPRSPGARTAIASVGQRQALLHDLASAVGIRKDVDSPELTPVARRELAGDRVAVVFAPMNDDVRTILAAASRVPLLEAGLGAGTGRRRGA